MKAFCWVSVSAVAFLCSGAAAAQSAGQTTDPAAAAQGTDLPAANDEIVVTAERRSTSLQRTGVAATVLSGEDLVRKSINTVEQLQFASPSLTVNTTGQGNNFNIRGIGKGEPGSAISVGVVTYRDGVATLPGYFQAEPYYDIASIEVLRGPQGTFAGSNATGGAVFITEKNPDLNSVNGYALAQYGNYDNIKVQGAVNLPISETLALRVAGNMDRRDTFFTVTGPWTGNPGDRRDYSGRASLLWQPSANLRVLLKGDYNNLEYGGIPGSRAYFGPATNPVRNTADPLLVEHDAFLAGRDEFGRIVGNISYTFDSGLILRSITGFQRGTTQVSTDNDQTATPGTPTAPARQGSNKITEEIWSQEFNIVSPDTGPFTWVLGGFWQHDQIYIPEGGLIDDVTPNTFVPLNIDVSTTGTNPKTALAAFGQVGYELSEGLQVTLGARWSRTTSANRATARTPQIPTLVLTQDDFTADKRVNGKAAVNWTIDANHFLYAFVATGSKAGGLNGPNLFAVPPATFEAEDVTDYELGWKGTFMDGRLRTQLGGYYNVYRNFQVSIVDPRSPLFSSVLNVTGKTKLYGLEFSMQGSFDAFSFDFATGIARSELGTFFAADARLGAAAAVCNPETGPATARCIAIGGRDQPYAPELTLSAGAQYAIPLSGDATLTPRVDYSQTGAVWATLFQNAALGDRLPARNIVNAQLTLTTGKWTIGAYSTNLTDQHYVGAINGTKRLAGPPRQYGIRASISF
ncbi:TonB-dependent receptor [Sphingomonas sp. Y38-1Y]|uniref:TonB-dependent receptor n=1 Tax=Sphingomonas sp. Y38-1Y TaxID=3078265 RepID=UPI0028ED3C19|nr:TonB-dependent receptor [Sphingomonas sp. Y38-1Y]